jgi:hypothetical protein
MLRKIFLGSAVVVLLSACAAKMVAPPSESLREDLSLLGLVVDIEQSVDPPKEPVKGTGSAALTGAGQGAVGTFAGTASGFCQAGGPFGCAVGIVLGAVLAPVGAFVGAGVGASKSHSAEEVENAQRAMLKILRQMRPAKDLTDYFRKGITSAHGTMIVPVHCSMVTKQCEARDGIEPKYVLRLGYLDFIFRAYGRIEPDIYLTAKAGAVLFQFSDQHKVYERQWGYKGSQANYFELAKNDGAGFAELIKNAHKKIAFQIIKDLIETPAPTPVGSPEEDTVWTVDGPAVEKGQTNAARNGADQESQADDNY